MSEIARRNRTGKVIVNNKLIAIMIPFVNLDEYLNKGWVKGRLRKESDNI